MVCLSTEAPKEASGEDERIQLNPTDIVHCSLVSVTASNEGPEEVQVKSERTQSFSNLDPIKLPAVSDPSERNGPAPSGATLQSQFPPAVDQATLNHGPEETDERERDPSVETSLANELLVVSDQATSNQRPQEVEDECEDMGSVPALETAQPHEIPAVSDRNITDQGPELAKDKYEVKVTEATSHSHEMYPVSDPTSDQGPEEERDECEGHRSDLSGKIPQPHELLGDSNQGRKHDIEYLNGIGLPEVV